MIGSFKQALKSDQFLCFSKVVSLAGKMWLLAKNWSDSWKTRTDESR